MKTDALGGRNTGKSWKLSPARRAERQALIAEIIREAHGLKQPEKAGPSSQPAPARVATGERTVARMVYIYGLWLNGHIQYVGVGRDPRQRVREFILGSNVRLKAILAQGARVVLLQEVPKRGSHVVKGRMV